MKLVTTFLFAALLAGAPAQAVVVAPGDGTQDTSAPTDDPGWANVGLRGGLTAVYLGNGWVLTASHVGSGPTALGGVIYDPVPGSTVQFESYPGRLADLIVFKLSQDPGLPTLAIAANTPPTGADVVMIGHGPNRGAATTWNGISGWFWGSGNSMRWGTNRVAAAPQDVILGSNVSRAFWTDLTQSPPPQVTAQESQAGTGDSGGAVFHKNGTDWEVAGVLFAIQTYAGQPASTTFYGNATFAVDLSFYRSAIQAVTTTPACSDGLDDDRDGLVDFPNDPGCESADDLDERSPLLACDDGADNDADGKADYVAAGGGDPGCYDALSARESPQCQDGLDNDNAPGIDFDGGASLDLDKNGFIDAQFNPATPAVGAADPDCGIPSKNRETVRYCGLGFELAFLAPLLARLGGKRRA